MAPPAPSAPPPPYELPPRARPLRKVRPLSVSELLASISNRRNAGWVARRAIVMPWPLPSMVSAAPLVRKNADGPNSVLPTDVSLLDRVSAIVLPLIAFANVIVSPAPALLIAARNVQLLLHDPAVSAVLVTVQVVAKAFADKSSAPGSQSARSFIVNFRGVESGCGW